MPSINHFQKRSLLIEQLNAEIKAGKTIGFVPTMGALHQGHLSLVEQAKKECDIVVVSIYVNPLQFNNPNDLKNYPRSLANDFTLLSNHGNIIVFCPSFDDVFPNGEEQYAVNVGKIATLLEGHYRPGHFTGVIKVVNALFDLIKPNKAYFGNKDYQQVLIVKKMVQFLGQDIKIIACQTQRSKNGLAMSSRNALLSEQEGREAALIYEALKLCKEKINSLSPADLKAEASSLFENGPLKLEYLEIVSADELVPINNWEQKSICCIAAYCGKVRLIDNLMLN